MLESQWRLKRLGYWFGRSVMLQLWLDSAWKKNDSCGAHRPHWFLAVNSHLQALTTAFANHRGPSESRLSCDAFLLHVLQCACVNTGAGTIVVDAIHNCTITPASFSTLWSFKKMILIHISDTFHARRTFPRTLNDLHKIPTFFECVCLLSCKHIKQLKKDLLMRTAVVPATMSSVGGSFPKTLCG